jgi:hypothetical protein
MSSMAATRLAALGLDSPAGARFVGWLWGTAGGAVSPVIGLLVIVSLVIVSGEMPRVLSSTVHLLTVRRPLPGSRRSRPGPAAPRKLWPRTARLLRAASGLQHAASGGSYRFVVTDRGEFAGG